MTTPEIAQAKARGIDAARRLASLPRNLRCHPTCPGWFIGEYDSDGLSRPQRCDECASSREEYHTTVTHDHDLATEVADDDVACMPAAIRALAKVVCGRTKGRIARNALMREHALRIVIADSLTWLENRRKDADPDIVGAIERLESAP